MHSFALSSLLFTISSAALLSSIGAAAQGQAGRPLAIEDYYYFESIGRVQLRPDGRWVAFTVSHPVEADNSDQSSLWVASNIGSVPAQRILHQGQDVDRLSWSEDGHLLYDHGFATWALDLDRPGSEARRFDRNSNDPSIPSPDGSRAARLRNTEQKVTNTRDASEFERRHQERFKGAIFDWMNFQRDGARFPVPDPRIRPAQEIFIDEVDGGEDIQLTDLGLRPGQVTWSPRGDLLAFVADEHFRDEMTYARSDLWTVSIDGEVNRFTDDGYNYGSLGFSPDGEHLSYVRSYGTDMVIEQKLDHGGPRDLFIRPVDGGEEICLTLDWDLEPRQPRWSPDNQHIYFTAGIGGAVHLFRVPRAGGEVEQVTQGQRRLGNLSISEDFLTMVYTVDRFDAPADLFAANIDGSEERQLSYINGGLRNSIGLSKADRLQFESKDGTPIEGWLLYPHGYAEDKGPYPMIVNSHGGPHSASGYRFNFKQQYFAAQGYFVLQVNFRGSTGYGEDFKWAIWGAWGDKDGEDVMAGVDHAIAEYPIDAARVGHTGHSYGGFMTNWLITQYPDRFAAAICGAGISNWISDYGTADIARTKETEFFGTPWEEEGQRRLLRQSPLIYAGRVQTPTLFVHGELDQRVPYEEAEQMYTALKKNGVPAKMIQYKSQAHGIRGHWNVVHRIINELDWWERYLGK